MAVVAEAGTVTAMKTMMDTTMTTTTMMTTSAA
jgi:hypothetical protein